jgi:hypothetical protein
MAPKIRVQFDLDPEAAKELLNSGSKVEYPITDETLRKLASEGPIRVSDYLDEDDVLFLAVPKKLKKVGSKFSRKVVPALFVGDIVHTVVSSAAETPEDRTPRE